MAKNKPGSSRKDKKQPPHYSDDWNVVDNLRVDVEDPSKIHKRARLIRRAIIGAPALALVAILMSASVNSSVSDINTTLEEMDREVQVDSPGKNAALLAIDDWLNAKNQPLPGGYVLSWDGREVLAEYSLVIDEETGKEVETLGREIHNFTLANKTGILYTSSVLTLWTPNRGAIVHGTPSLLPKAPAAASSITGTNWLALGQGESTDHMKTAVDAWVEAYMSGDPNKLRQIVGDPVATNSYMPMLQVSSAVATLGEVGTNEVLAEADQAIVRADIAVRWSGVKIEASDTDIPVLSYDLLIDKVSTASPVVVAWTDAGRGESLKPYANAISGLDITVENQSYVANPNESAEGAE